MYRLLVTMIMSGILTQPVFVEAVDHPANTRAEITRHLQRYLESGRSSSQVRSIEEGSMVRIFGSLPEVSRRVFVQFGNRQKGELYARRISRTVNRDSNTHLWRVELWAYVPVGNNLDDRYIATVTLQFRVDDLPSVWDLVVRIQ